MTATNRKPTPKIRPSKPAPLTPGEKSRLAALPDTLTPEDAAAYVGVDAATVCGWCRKKLLPATKWGDSWRIRKADLLAFGRSNQT